MFQKAFERLVHVIRARFSSADSSAVFSSDTVMTKRLLHEAVVVAQSFTRHRRHYRIIRFAAGAVIPPQHCPRPLVLLADEAPFSSLAQSRSEDRQWIAHLQVAANTAAWTVARSCMDGDVRREHGASSCTTAREETRHGNNPTHGTGGTTTREGRDVHLDRQPPTPPPPPAQASQKSLVYLGGRRGYYFASPDIDFFFWHPMESFSAAHTTIEVNVDGDDHMMRICRKGRPSHQDVQMYIVWQKLTILST
ncbi:hypothetical protein CCM_02070 [Cordyceps militaris CM01]|uniref:Uncharacterized protein n=1 Tax=Cordyceps militaris (strain CM01) TaxID=983644 RepID=G3JCI9_CORMM|nr:uncharacterized protein CCM_02070 [Cordyceps militaris CM01]EGX93801.1 hypothetical protein CCM_02070 [Cordyceps militaris CM01]